MKNSDFKIRLGDKSHAAGVARELADLKGVRVEQNGHGWEVVIGGSITDRVVVSVLDGLRRALAGEPTATAWVFLNGRKYQFDAE